MFYCVFYLVFLAELELLARQPAHILFNSEKNADFSEPWSAKIGLSHHAMGPCQLVELSMWVLLGDRDIDRLGLVKVSQSMKMKTALSKISNH